jgi:hypothetical protein
MMIVRIAAVAVVLATFVALGTSRNGSGVSLEPTTAAAAPVAAPAATSTDGLQFSTRVSSDGKPEDPRTEFGDGTNTVWASFQYHEHDSNAKVSYLVRADGEDYKYGTLDCCKGSNGRYAFPITKKNGHGDLPGAAYDVRVYVNDAEVAHGGFGVKGRDGLDHDGQENGNGNDND